MMRRNEKHGTALAASDTLTTNTHYPVQQLDPHIQPPFFSH
jgi:hypothetical protein